MTPVVSTCMCKVCFPSSAWLQSLAWAPFCRLPTEFQCGCSPDQRVMACQGSAVTACSNDVLTDEQRSSSFSLIPSIPKGACRPLWYQERQLLHTCPPVRYWGLLMNHQSYHYRASLRCPSHSPLWSTSQVSRAACLRFWSFSAVTPDCQIVRTFILGQSRVGAAGDGPVAAQTEQPWRRAARR